MSEVVSLGQRLTVTFLPFCSATGLLNVLGGFPWNAVGTLYCSRPRRIHSFHCRCCVEYPSVEENRLVPEVFGGAELALALAQFSRHYRMVRSF
jgi:hypothetical protein